jgi:hypothetical protein
MLNQLTCPNCGAALPPELAKSDVVTCQYCHTTFRVPHTFTPEPDMGDLIIGADFRTQPIPGWTIPNDDSVSRVDNSSPEFRVKVKGDEFNHFLLKSSGEFDDVDVGVTLNFYSGTADLIKGGLILRYREKVGGYIFYISPIGTYKLADYQPDKKGALVWNNMTDWQSNNLIHKGLNQTNRLRVIVMGNHFKIYINGVIVTTIHDDKFDEGQIIVGAEGSEKSSAEVGFSDLQVREVPSEKN